MLREPCTLLQEPLTSTEPTIRMPLFAHLVVEVRPRDRPWLLALCTIHESLNLQLFLHTAVLHCLILDKQVGVIVQLSVLKWYVLGWLQI